MQCNELTPVIRMYEIRFAMFHQNWERGVSSQSLEIVPLRKGPHGCIHPHFVTAPIAELIVNEADGSDMVGVCGPQPYDIAVLMIKPPPLLMPVGQLQAFFTP